MNNIKKPTNQLLSELASADSICEFLKSNSDVFIDKNLAELLSRLLETKDLNKSAVLKKAEINDIYGHQIFSGVRRPSRDKLICILIGMELSLDQAQTLLKSAGFPILYPKIKRDSIIINSFINKISVFETNNILYEHGQKLL